MRISDWSSDVCSSDLLFDRQLIFNTADFYYDFKNIQFQRVDAGVVRTVNGPSAKLYGAEVELTGRVTPNLTLRANGGYLHSRFGDFPGAPNSNRLHNGRNDFGDPTDRHRVVCGTSVSVRVDRGRCSSIKKKNKKHKKCIKSL